MNRDQIQDAMRRMGIDPAGTNGDWVQARCPFAATRHAKGTDRTPSFGVKAGPRSWYNCLACKSKGQFIDLPGELGLPNYEELAHDLLVGEATGLVIEAETYEVLEDLKPLPEGVYGDLFYAVDGDALTYLEGRGISAETADRIGLGDWPEDKKIMFPIRGFDRRLYGWTGRSYDPDVTRAKVWNLKGVDKSCHLLGADLCTCDRPIVIVEGLMFYARLHEINIGYQLGMDVVAAMGSALSFEQADLLAQVGQPVTFFFDNDKAGKIGTWGDEKKGTTGAVQLVSKSLPTRTVTFPGKLQDPDDLTDDQVLSMIADAKLYARRRVRA